MNKTELVIQLLKIAIGIAFAAYFLCGAWPSSRSYPRPNRSVGGRAPELERLWFQDASHKLKGC